MKKPKQPRPTKRKRTATVDPAVIAARAAESYSRRVYMNLDRLGDTRSLFLEAIAGRGNGLDVLAESNPEMHGPIAVAMFLHKVPPAKLRPVLRSAWLYQFGSVARAAQSQGGFMFDMLRYAEFALPDDLPETFDAWRGVAGKSLSAARAGWSWTLSRDFACFVALKLRAGQGAPMVLRRTIRRSDVVGYFGMESVLGEREVIADQAPAGDVDGDPADWAEGVARWIEYATSEETAEDWAQHAAELVS